MKKIFSICLSLAMGAFLAGCQSNSQKMTAEEYLGYDPDEPQMQIGDSIAIVQTQYGKIQGFIQRGIYTWIGVPYGAPTGGENRFMPAKAPEPWEGVLPTVFWGDSAPQDTPNKWTTGSDNYESFTHHWNYYNYSEDCLRLNVWSPKPDNQKRPVIVWLHGGGYTFGNSIEHDGYKGENLARKGDVVFVSINHRLGAFGFSDFSAVDEKYKNSGNVGSTDMTFAFKWIHENIANFGGDPDNVTIIGQSGGGAKVCDMVASPDNKGLIHKAIALSGNHNKAQDQAVTQQLGKYICEKGGGMEKLQQMSWEEYYKLANDCAKEFAEAHPDLGRVSFAPIADGIHLPKGEYFTNKSDWSNNIPMIFVTTTEEWNRTRGDAKLAEITKEEAIKTIAQGSRFSAGAMDEAKAAKVYEAYEKVAKALGKNKPIDVVNLASAPRTGVVTTANSKLAQDAPVYMAWFDYQPDMFNGRMHAFHCLDICFWFGNTDYMESHTGGGKKPRELSDRMVSALVNFMKTGDPNTEKLPTWPKYTADKGELMYLNVDSKVMEDPDRAARETLK